MKNNWHSITFQEVGKKLNTHLIQGLTDKEVRLRQNQYGTNELPTEKPLSNLKIFLEQFYSPLIYILLITGFITLILQEFTDSIIIFASVFINVIVGFIQESKASKTLQELKKVVKHEAEVIRNGKPKIINSKNLTIGDIVVLNPGDKVPADGRIIECYDLKINEMALTGEWMPAQKTSKVLPEETPMADRDNMVYMGTIIESGKGKIIVTETGHKSKIGEITKLIEETKEEKTPYQKRLARFSKVVGIVIAVICFGIFLEGIIAGGEFTEMLTTAVAVAVAAIPEGLPVAMTVILAIGMQRISKKKGLVRRMASAETLGSTSIIATDKTATLTEGRMKVGEIIASSEVLGKKKQDEYTKKLAAKTAVICVEAFIENQDDVFANWIFRGRPTDKALLEQGAKMKLFKEEMLKQEPSILHLPFDSMHKYSASLHEIIDSPNNQKVLYVLGAPEKIIEASSLSKEEKEKLEAKVEELAKKGLRLVASAYKNIPEIPDEVNRQFIEGEIKELIFSGIITLKDPVRKEVKESMRICQEAGMRPIIVTGDHKLTAQAVAEEIGLPAKDNEILNGIELDKLSDVEFNNVLEKTKIYTRVEPRHKMRIVETWQNKGEVVAMTGDGINDAPALKKADIGVAIGSGTEVAKETSDLILLNNSFSIIVAAVEEGRAILDNIRKVITYLLSGSFSEIILVTFSILAGLPLPITAAQILWVNLVEDGLPDMALAFEPKEKGLMRQKPQKHKTPLLTREMKVIIIFIGLITDLLLFALFIWLFGKNYDISYIRTMIFVALAIDSLFYVFSCKSLKHNLWEINVFNNKFLLGAWVFGIIALLSSVYLPLFQKLLGTVPLYLRDWWILIVFALVNIVFIEIAKYYFIAKKRVDN